MKAFQFARTLLATATAAMLLTSCATTSHLSVWGRECPSCGRQMTQCYYVQQDDWDGTCYVWRGSSTSGRYLGGASSYGAAEQIIRNDNPPLTPYNLGDLYFCSQKCVDAFRGELDAMDKAIESLGQEWDAFWDILGE
jgi:hypothetical protein